MESPPEFSGIRTHPQSYPALERRVKRQADFRDTQADKGRDTKGRYKRCADWNDKAERELRGGRNSLALQRKILNN